MGSKLSLVIVIMALASVFAGCQKKTKLENRADKPVAKVYDKYLMMSDIAKAIPKGLSPDDSAYAAENYINRWIKEQLLINLANNYLKDEKKDIDRKVEEFRQSLLIHTLKNKIIAQKLDTAITQQQIRQYYEAHKQDFVLSVPVVQGYLIKIPLDNQDIIDQVKQLVSYNLPSDVTKAQKLAQSNNGMFLDFRSSWKNFTEIESYLPFSISNPEYFLQNKRILETTDDQFYYYLRITDFALQGDTEPFELAQDEIRKILQNEEGERIFSDLEKTLYTNGIKKGSVKIFY